MTHTPHHLRTEPLDAPLAKQWTLHHVLLDGVSELLGGDDDE